MAVKRNRQQRRPIVKLSSKKAKRFFLKQETYCSIELPPYFQFDNILKETSKVLNGKPLSDLWVGSPKGYEGVNHVILNNKDGRYAWRPLELIHPAVYVALVNDMTEKNNWKLIRNLFKAYSRSKRVTCLSVPVESKSNQSDRAELVTQWWRRVEQKAIELALDYNFIIQTDIVDCYAAIYTHSIPWALHTKQTAKSAQSDKKLIGNVIDRHIQSMRFGQTNGIPQGSVLMDFIAEIVLGYADAELERKVNNQDIKGYHILRYRDDYRIFTNDSRDGEYILRTLAEVMIELGLKLNPAKTDRSEEVITASIKEDKLAWTFRRQSDKNLQRHLLIIHDHSMAHGNSGTLYTALYRFYKRLRKFSSLRDPMPLVSIVVEIAYQNPRTYRVSAAILSKLFSFLKSNREKRNIVKKIKRRFSQIPNTGHMEIWLQRMSYQFAPETSYDEPLCKLIRKEQPRIWNNDWISSKKLRKAINAEMIVNWKQLRTTPSIVDTSEVELFSSQYY